MAKNWERIAAIYREILFKNTSESSVPNNDTPLSFIKRYIPKNLDAYILDAGSGNGRYMRKMKEFGYNNVYGIDLFQNIVGFGNYVCASIESIPFANVSFDIIYSLSVIFYLDKPVEAIKEYFRLLRPGSYLIITCHTKYSLFTLDRILKRKLKPSTVKHLNGVSFYSSFEYKKMMEETGFEVVQIDGYKLSYFLWPFIKKIISLIIRIINLNPRRISLYIKEKVLDSNELKRGNKALALLRSIFGYHSVLVGYKPR